MTSKIITDSKITKFQKYLVSEEKSAATVEKYLRDLRAFYAYVGDRSVNKNVVTEYKNHLFQRGYAPRSINSMLASLHSFFTFAKWCDCKVKFVRLQREIYSRRERELTKAEYKRLLNAAKNEQLNLIMQTICSTGIRVSELRYFTVESVKRGEITVRLKGKIRSVLIPNKLRNMLLSFAKRQKIRFGEIFLAQNGKSLSRKAIWYAMKSLCKRAGVPQSKVFPHNLRKLFARSFYAVDKDISKLADVLGHSSIDTTRIYIKTNSSEHLRKIECLGLVLQQKNTPT